MCPVVDNSYRAQYYLDMELLHIIGFISIGFSVGAYVGHSVGHVNGYEDGINDASNMEDFTDRMVE